MRISEERMKKALGTPGGKTSASAHRPDPEPAIPAKPLASVEAGNPADDPAWEWITYGQMTPVFLKEVAGAMDEIIGPPSVALPDSRAPHINGQIRMLTRVRALLERWARSTEAYRDPLPNSNVAGLIQMALMARDRELRRSGIRTQFEDAAGEAGGRGGTPALYQSVLHVLQYCIERMRGGSDGKKLTVRLQHSGERLETSFLCEFSEETSAHSAGTRFPWEESLRLDAIQLQGARKLLDSVGGTLVLENISQSLKAVRISLNISSLPTGENL